MYGGVGGRSREASPYPDIGGPPLGMPLTKAARNTVSKLRVQSFAYFPSSYGLGRNQDLQNPLGVGALNDGVVFPHARLRENARP